MKARWRNIMLRRNFLALSTVGIGQGPLAAARRCGCAFAPPAVDTESFAGLQSGLKVTGMKVFGVSLTPDSDRPYVFVKIETNQGVIGWGEATLEGKAGAALACLEDFRDF